MAARYCRKHGPFQGSTLTKCPTCRVDEKLTTGQQGNLHLVSGTLPKWFRQDQPRLKWSEATDLIDQP